MNHSFRSLCFSLTLFALPAVGQLGAPTGEEFNAQAVATAALGGTWDGLRGVVRTISNTYWVSARSSAPSVSLRLLEFSDTGVYLGSVALPATLNASGTGLLDLAYDPLANVIYGGCEHTVSGRQLFAFRVGTRVFDAAINVAVPATVPGNAVRGLTYDRFGNGGAGSFLCVDGTTAITEFSRTGSVLRTLTNPHPNATALAIDATDRRLWVFGPGGSTRANEGVVGVAVDLGSGQATGLMMLGSPTYPGAPAGGNVTGAEFATYAHDHTVDRLSLLTNASSDWVYELEGRFAYGGTCGGLIAFRGDAPYAGNATWMVTLQGSAATSAFLLLGFDQATTPIAAPLFASGCYLQTSLAPAPLSLGGAIVTGGNAQLAVPIPAGVRGSIYFQWIEVGSALPLRSSNGGGAYLR